MGFNLDIDEYKFPLDIFQGDKKIRVTHILRAPTDDELEGYTERLTEWDKDNNTYKPNRTKAAIWLWDKVVVSVEGYDFAGEFQSVKGKIPFTHKIPCINEILSVAGIVSEDEAAEIAKK